MFYFDAMMSEIFQRKVPVRREAKTRYEGHFLIVMTPVTLHLSILNRTASQILGMCDGKRSITEIGQMFAEYFPDVDKKELFRDFVHTLRDLEAAEIISLKGETISEAG